MSMTHHMPIALNRTPSHLADTSDPCPRPMQTDRHGQPPIGVSSCPVGEIRRWGCLQRSVLARSLIKSNALGGTTDDQTALQ